MTRGFIKVRNTHVGKRGDMRRRQDSIIDGVAIDEGLCTWDVLDGWEAATRSIGLRVGKVRGAYGR